MYSSTHSEDILPSLDELRQESLPAKEAACFIQDDLLLDGNPALNLAGFANTFMEPEIEQLMTKNLPKNITHVEAYPASNAIEKRCINIIARLFNAPLETPESEAVGVSTLGSSEAIILAVLAAKRRWQYSRERNDQPYGKPNMIMSSTVHVCWKKAARYLDIEQRYTTCSQERYTLDPHEAVSLVDEDTILVCAILGSSYTGEYENVALLDQLLQEKNKEKNLSVGIHVDAASGGFVAPFICPELIWDFRLPLVNSINVSGHKYGLTYAAVGWGIWRSRGYLPSDLLFTLNYCGSVQTTCTLNFSKSAVHVLGQYYQLIRLGRYGYCEIMTSLTKIAAYLTSSIQEMSGGDKFVVMSRGQGQGLPIVAWRLRHSERYDEYDIARQLRLKGWIVPAFTLETESGELKMLRVIIRVDLGWRRCAQLVQHLQSAMESLDQRADFASG
ncbi:glutamate decarboxylase [Zopfia rhizophila CBS 207.26]|uniref:Glutamate decarboxylase n=1 Tax=Zopfia rhizophila CBS 207.26 TaxID=1314779 RepID=A0A6A6ED69_9PEZI|nr:glutamate decarboxylase [Zopfia rhizophila CBS 207.26]